MGKIEVFGGVKEIWEMALKARMNVTLKTHQVNYISQKKKKYTHKFLLI